ncbi:MAG: phytanoyl-CoA dioxygenase family protein [Alphaproteobacteria bacterium]|nr:phytanoyl-CoA dioxygenase family protein [Alphaproteobacteria bacterium]
MAGLRTVEPTTAVDDIMAILDRDGAVIVRLLLDPPTMARIHAELGPYLTRAYLGEGEFWGRKTKRVAALVAKSRTFAEKVAPNPLLMAVMDKLLGPHCVRFQLHVTQAVHIGPGEKGQILHRDDGLLPFVHPGPQALCNTMWALTDFTAANGATNVIPGSHLWDDDRMPTDKDTVVQAEMPRGSCLIYVGSVWHGGGANATKDQWRTGMICGYSLAWLRQEENQYVAVPPAIARDLPDQVQRLIGYTNHGPFLGWYEGQDVHVVLEPHVADVMPATPEGGEATDETRLLKTVRFVAPRMIGIA